MLEVEITRIILQTYKSNSHPSCIQCSVGAQTEALTPVLNNESEDNDGRMIIAERQAWRDCMQLRSGASLHLQQI